MRPQLKLSIALACGLLATATASADPACVVTLSSMLAGGQMVLQAVCTGGPVTAIDWKRNGSEIIANGVVLATAVPDGQHIYLTTQALSGQYTANGSAVVSPGPYTFDTTNVPMTLNLSDPVLTVAATVGGSVSAASGISGCTSAGGTCSASYTAGSTIQLTATPSTGYIFSTWGGDCTGAANVCALNMATLRTVSAAFATSPVAGACGAADGVANASRPVDSLCANGTTASAVSNPNNTWAWTCTGINSTAAPVPCHANQILPSACGTDNSTSVALSATPSANACGANNTLSGMVLPTSGNNYLYQWSCTGLNNTVPATCSAPAASVTGTCNTTTTGALQSSAPSALCATGNPGSVTTNAGTYTWACTGTGPNPGTPAACTANRTAACGTAQGATVSSAPSGTAACAVGTTPTPVLTGSSYGWTCTGQSAAGGNTASCSATYQASTGCGATPSNFAVQAWTGYANSGNTLSQTIPAGTGIALQFTMNQTSYPFGYVMNDQGSGSKTYAFSTCPGVMDGAHAILGQDGTTSVNGDAYLDNCISIAGGYMRPVNTSGSTSVFYSGSKLSQQKTCFLPTTTSLGSSTPAVYYLNIIDNSSTTDASIQLKLATQIN